MKTTKKKTYAVPVTFRVRPDIHLALGRLAKQEGITRSKTGAALLEEALTARGVLQADE